MIRKAKFAIAAGGTAGHINPALALAEELSSRGHEVVFVGQASRLEGTLVPQAGFAFIPIEVSGFDRSRPWSLVTALARIHLAKRELAKSFEDSSYPDVAIGFGAYVELPLLQLCAKKGIPYALHEQNSVPGLANKVRVHDASLLALAFPEAEKAFEKHLGPATQVVFTGNPVRSSITSASREKGRELLGISDDALLLLVFGGSLGAHHLNETFLALKNDLLATPKLCVVHSTGADEYETLKESFALSAKEAQRYKLMPYISSMGEALAAADVVVSRAGASSIAEIAAVGVPSILVPYPLATEDHQRVNANYLVDAGAAELVLDKNLDDASFKELLIRLLSDEDTRKAMREAAARLGSKEAAKTLADHMESLL